MPLSASVSVTADSGVPLLTTGNNVASNSRQSSTAPGRQLDVEKVHTTAFPQAAHTTGQTSHRDHAPFSELTLMDEEPDAVLDSQSHGSPIGPRNVREVGNVSLENIDLHLKFHPIPTLELSRSAMSTFLGSLLIITVYVAPSAANEFFIKSPFLRGLLSSFLILFPIGSAFLINAPTLVCGKIFDKRFVGCVPITVAVVLALSYIPAGGNDLSLGIAPICLIGTILGFAGCIVILNLPIFLSNEHKALDQSCGPPFTFCVVMFFVSIIGYLEAIQRFSSPLVGLLLPLLCATFEWSTLALLEKSYVQFYLAPKANFLHKLHEFAQSNCYVDLDPQLEPTVVPPEPTGVAAEPTGVPPDPTGVPPVPDPTGVPLDPNGVPPDPIGVPPDPTEAPLRPTPSIRGDQESVFGNLIATTAVLVECLPVVVTLLEVSRQPSSRSWIVGLSLTLVVDILKHTAVWHTVLVYLLSPSGKQGLVMLSAIHVAYIRAQRGACMVAVSLVVAVGSFRAFVFDDLRAVIWLDIHPSVALALGAVVVKEIGEGCILMWIDHKDFRLTFPISSKYCVALECQGLELASAHPLGDTSHREFPRSTSYIFVISMSLCITLVALLTFLGPAFILGICKNVAAPGHDVWRTGWLSSESC